ncbi:hypothetical protein O7627_11810 [Solwaraspora sp. WMMD1047]|uniref:hypothetical protein n=1 Tax=Solwaraspora sp. WMMD1047 TaxID=3016102 RepID=UPI002417327E|nr:hypothetical protein [Solwaraspora sp. WMMD1047]MDG4829984.1 hypothetical protein [Solwaraspora sp. WMMD1047]
MTDRTHALRTIEVDADVYDVLERTASTRGTDINGALHYLIAVPSAPAAADDDED